MTLEDAGKKFVLPLSTLEQYVSFGFIKKSGKRGETENYREEDFEQLGLVNTLFSAGFTPEEIKKYLTLTAKTGTDEQQIRMLKKQRRLLLDGIHKQQKILDSLDFMIWDKRAKKENK